MGITLLKNKATAAYPMDVTIIVPTYREAENLPLLIPRLAAALQDAGIAGEILVVDDNSPDETTSVCHTLSACYPVRLIVRKSERGLSSAVLHGMRNALGAVLIVMDADLSHPPEKVPELYHLIATGGADFVIGSRFAPSGSMDEKWSLYRWANALIARCLARPLSHVHDPLSGFFALPRSAFVTASHLDPVGYKIGLELLVKCAPRRVTEIPIHFADRAHGTSKLNWKEQLNYLRHLSRLYAFLLWRLLGK